MKRKGLLFCFIMILALNLMGCKTTRDEALKFQADLVVYTPLSKDIYEPVIREFENRNNLCVKVYQEPEEEIVEQAKINWREFEGDVVLGISETVADENAMLFQEREEMASSSYVLIYNTNIVIYNELPKDISSLAEKKWKGKIGFLNPNTSGIAQNIIQFAKRQTFDGKKINMDDFYDNVQDSYADSMEEIVQGVCEGKYAMGVVAKGVADSLTAEKEEISSIPLAAADCRMTYMSVSTMKQEPSPYTQQFLEFTGSKDVRRYLTEYLNFQLPVGEAERWTK